MRFFIETLSCRMSSIFEGAVYYAEIYFFEKDATFWRPFGYKNKKKAEWMPTNLIQRIPKSRDTTQKKTRRVLSLIHKKNARAPKRGRRKRLESEIGGVFVVFAGGGDLRNLFFGGNFCDVNGRDLSGRKAN